ncbi:lipoprotein [Pseudoalteromonas sp. NBT06-2]|uniref:LPS translocon maturation chaperone LptM n=1 Tax=Pseudoalteromonas sp. NBT06-2 TaxID=2025950 RepID=UPI0011409ECD|nr:lipoprotein [Pseudoalteromonas sp. NBT06-2]
MQRITYRHITLFLCLLFIGACGQTGDLYLPKETQEKPKVTVEEKKENQQKKNKRDK